MRTGLTEASQQAAGKIPSQLLQHGLKASSQSGNTDTLLHRGFSPPALDCHTHRIPAKKKKSTEMSFHAKDQ